MQRPSKQSLFYACMAIAIVGAGVAIALLRSRHDVRVSVVHNAPPAKPALATGAALPRPSGSVAAPSNSVPVAVPSAQTTAAVLSASAGAPPPRVPSPATPTSLLPTDVRNLVAHFEDPSIPVPQRLQELKDLAKRGDALAVAVLEALGNEETYLNYAAVEALGQIHAPGVLEYLQTKTTNPDARVVCAAVKSLAALEGADAVSQIGVVLQANRARPDGHQDIVCGTCVVALGSIGSSAGVPLLATELKETYGYSLSHSYASQVVQALQSIGDPSGIPVLLTYVDRLTVEKQKMAKNPMGLEYLNGKITEAQKAAASLQKK